MTTSLRLNQIVENEAKRKKKTILNFLKRNIYKILNTLWFEPCRLNHLDLDGSIDVDIIYLFIGIK